jgi:hypothetical protein
MRARCTQALQLRVVGRRQRALAAGLLQHLAVLQAGLLLDLLGRHRLGEGRALALGNGRCGLRRARRRQARAGQQRSCREQPPPGKRAWRSAQRGARAPGQRQVAPGRRAPKSGSVRHGRRSGGLPGHAGVACEMVPRRAGLPGPVRRLSVVAPARRPPASSAARAATTAWPAPAAPPPVLTMKKVGQPMVSASTPASGPTHTRPTDAKADSIANWVAVKRWLHRLIRKARKAAVPMPPDRFSKATTISSRRPPGGLGQRRSPSRRPAASPGSCPCLGGQPPEAQVAGHLQHAEQQQRAPQAQAQHQRPPSRRTADGQPQADDLVDHAHLGRAEGHGLQQEGRQQRAGEGITQLVEHDEQQDGRRAGVAK